ncbi:MAG: glutamine-hydrolyzing GMP synthase [Clostridia bacterium]|nr:glutamine-hydrolyzing GMP synthase [Clostridia bacterium]
MQQVTLLDFGAAYTQRLARIIRDANVYCEVLPHTAPLDAVLAGKPRGLILCGGGMSVALQDAPRGPEGLFSRGVPMLGIGYGFTLMAQVLGGEMHPLPEPGAEEEIEIKLAANSALFAKAAASFRVHGRCADHVERLPQGFTATALCANGRVFCMEDTRRKLYGVAAHGDVGEHPESSQMLHNFLFSICGCAGDWNMEAFIEACVQDIRAQVGQGRVLLGLSGGVDSSVCAALIHKAVGDRLTCVFVDTGFMRKDEPEQVREVFTRVFPVHLVSVDAADRFLAKLDGVDDPEIKRKRIGAEFIEVFAQEARALGQLDFLGQGTIYPDIIESGAIPGATVIKSHHNVGGLPKDLHFAGLVEPLRYLFKDEVRRVGEALGLPVDMVWRQPFPGPGLAVRVIGPITAKKLRIVREEIAAAGLDRSISQYFALLTGTHTVGLHGGERSYDHTVAIRAVVTDNFVTADWARVPHDVLARMSSRIVAEVPGVNRVVFDITGKPPAAIEWE